MKVLLFPFRVIYLIYALLTFLLLMLLVVPFVLVGSLMGKIHGGNFIYKACMFWGISWFYLIGIRHKNYYEVPHHKKTHYIFVGNHISYIDAAIIVNTIHQPTRVLGKIEMAKLPIFGYIYRNAIVTVDRSSSENRAKSVRILKSVVSKDISIFIFPEGTFNMGNTALKDFYDGAFRIAIETQTPIKPILFLDGLNRMHYKSIFSLCPGNSRSIFLDEISVAGYTANDVDLLKKKVYDIMEEKLIKYKASWIIK
jgi:1-acyl-sn-glycerol-3-phosphate acyltransferase